MTTIKGLDVFDFFSADGLWGEAAALLATPGPVWELLARMDAFLAQWPKFEVLGKVHATAVLEGDVHVSEGVVIEAGAYVQGPTVLGPGTEVRHGAYVRGHVLAGQRCVIGHTTEVKHTLLLNGAKAAHFAYLGDCVLGQEVNLGAGTKCANFKIETRPDRQVMVRPPGHAPVETGLRKLGAVLGDRVELGCNCVTMPGAFVGPGTLVYPNMTLRGIVPGRSIVKPAGELFVVTERRPE